MITKQTTNTAPAMPPNNPVNEMTKSFNNAEIVLQKSITLFVLVLKDTKITHENIKMPTGQPATKNNAALCIARNI